MFKMLFVGCGGSGGAVVGYLMDQLRADCQRVGIDKIPGIWQFVHVDMPPHPIPVASGLGTIAQLGGHYIGLAPDVGKYELLDNALVGSQGVRGDIATWAARKPPEVMVPIQLGAGQQRGIGRVAVLSKAAKLREGLQKVVTQLKDPSAQQQAQAAVSKLPTLGTPHQEVYTFIISSMAGGTGASISLDVARLLADITGNPGMTAMFMCTSDVFDDLDVTNRQGVRANALAMLGELAACQNGVSGAHDTQLLSQLGVIAGTTGSTFRRIIPLSSRRGQGSPIGDRKPHTIYRVNGQALAALAMSEKALFAIRGKVIENETVNDFLVKDLYGWGQGESSVAWGSMGYACLSTGRDRLESFGAQWLARQGFDHLLRGHVEGEDPRDDKTIADALAATRFEAFCERIGLPATTDTDAVRAWINATFPQAECLEAARRVNSGPLGTAMPVPAQGVPAASYVTNLMTHLNSVDGSLLKGGQEAGYAQAYTWAQGVVDRLHAAVIDAVGRSGMVYTVALLDLLTAHVGQLAQKLYEFHQSVQTAAAGFPARLATAIGALQGSIQNPAAAVEPIRNLFLGRTDLLVRGRWCEVTSQTLAQFETQMLTPLRNALRHSQGEILREIGKPASPSGLATVHTDTYAEWPISGNLVDARWGASVNEVLLTDYRQFESETKRLIPLSVMTKDEGAPPLFADARKRAVKAVVTGSWPTAAGAEAPESLLSISRSPAFGALNKDPSTGENIDIFQGSYMWQVSAEQILDRALAWVRRSGFAFNDYVTTSIRALAEVHQEPSVVDALFQTLQLADPMTQVDSTAFNSTHKYPAVVQYAFSEIPLEGTPAGEQLLALAPQRGLEKETVDNLRSALALAGPSRIDVYGYYPPALPVAHSGVCAPAAEQWAAATSGQERSSFWNLRRSRPLGAALAMSQEERQAMVAAWFVGQLTGHVAIPADMSAGPVSVFDPVDQVWIPFPYPYLTAINEFRMTQDLLPAVLETHLVAVANFANSTPPGRSMFPYRALRRIWDTNATQATNASFGVATLEAETLLNEWRSTGQTPAGRPFGARPVPVDAESPELRTEKAKEWIARVLKHGQDNLGTDGRPFRTVLTPEQRFAAPMLRDLYPDISTMLPKITEMLALPLSTVGSSGPTNDAGFDY